MLDPDTVIRGQLGPQEQLVWAGPARTGILLRATDWYIIVLSLLCLGMVGYLLVAAFDQGGPWNWVRIVLLSGGLVGGLLLLIVRFLVDARRRSRTCYGVSSERVLFVTGVPPWEVRSLYLDTLTDVCFSVSPNGAGAILFGPRPLNWGWLSEREMQTAGWADIPRFELAGEVRQVYEVILAARRSLRSDQPR